VVVLERFLTLLGMLEDNELRQRAARADDRSTWGITAIELGSLVTTLAPNRVRPGGTVATLDRVADTAVTGFAEAEERECLPTGWDGKTAKAGAELAHMLGALATHGMVLELLDGGHIIRSVTVTRATAEHLSAATKKRRQSIGSVIGKLDTVSVHHRPTAGLWHERTDERIEVTFTKAQTDEVTAALGKRVEVAGLITRTVDDSIVSIRMRSLETLLDTGPRLTDLVGLDPDFTGGMEPPDYLREIRGAS